MNEKIAVIGLGYVGLPVALGFARHYPDTLGFDINPDRIAELSQGVDRTGEIASADLSASSLRYTCVLDDLSGANFFIVTVPTPIDTNRQPDLRPLDAACRSVGQRLSRGSVVVFESTVYPGLTEEFCGPLLAKVSGLLQGVDFKLAYSPERINPGDQKHTLESIVKVVAAEDAPTLERVAAAYERIIQAGVYRAKTIRVAEAAKVIENTQRDLNIALMNELALIFDRMGLRTHDVLDAASTKWNFLPFRPGLVGGHCIGVDPYYLTTKAKALGYYPQVILAGRRINDGMGAYIAQRCVKLLIAADKPVRHARIGVLGLSFKENVMDLRNSRIPDMIRELQQFGIEPILHDPLVDAQEAMREYALELSPLRALQNLDGLIYAVAHEHYVALGALGLRTMLNPGGVFIDVKSMLDPQDFAPPYVYWSL